MFAKLTIPILLAALVSCQAEKDSLNTASAPTESATSKPSTENSGAEKATSQPTAAASSGAKLNSDKFDQFGAGVSEGDAVPVADLLANPAKYAAAPVRVEGEIVSVCKKKGCWVKVGEGDKSLFVKFKDYGFFLPLDATGHIVLEGTASVKTVSVEELRHYLEDEGKLEEAKLITEPKTEVRFLASGAAIKKAE